MVSLRGFSTINFWADDVAAVAWYMELLGVMYNPHYLEILASTKLA